MRKIIELRILTVLGGLAALGFLAGCFETKQEFTLNPDGSGKVVHESKFQTMDLSDGKRGSDKQMKAAVAEIINEAKGVDAWRGPIWLPINYLLVAAIEGHDPAFAADLRERLVELVETDWERTGRFHEYFHAESGEGLGADAQAGWTALVANLVMDGWPAD
jgi:hypothetical protein